MILTGRSGKPFSANIASPRFREGHRPSRMTRLQLTQFGRCVLTRPPHLRSMAGGAGCWWPIAAAFCWVPPTSFCSRDPVRSTPGMPKILKPGKGIGRALMSRVFAECQEAGLPEIAWFCLSEAHHLDAAAKQNALPEFFTQRSILDGVDPV